MLDLMNARLLCRPLMNIKLLRRPSLIMDNLRRWVWYREEVASNEILPWNTLLCQLMHHYDLDQCIMIYAFELLCGVLHLHYGHHLFYISAHEKWNVHHSYLGKMHQQMDMVRI